MMRFNSKMVRLKAEEVKVPVLLYFSFNSKMVRLKGDDALNNVKDILQFQFQNGAIKSLNSPKLDIESMCFNSKMVRLKVTMPMAARLSRKVSIPKWCD